MYTKKNRLMALLLSLVLVMGLLPTVGFAEDDPELCLSSKKLSSGSRK